jgi:hypothetical protein
LISWLAYCGQAGRLVVERAGLQAAVQDPDEPVGELAERGAVAEAAGALPVVVGAGSGRYGQGGEGLAVKGVAASSRPPAVARPSALDGRPAALYRFAAQALVVIKPFAAFRPTALPRFR